MGSYTAVSSTNVDSYGSKGVDWMYDPYHPYQSVGSWTPDVSKLEKELLEAKEKIKDLEDRRKCDINIMHVYRQSIQTLELVVRQHGDKIVELEKQLEEHRLDQEVIKLPGRRIVIS